MKIEIEHEGSCLGATGGTGRLIVRDALAKGIPRSPLSSLPMRSNFKRPRSFCRRWRQTVSVRKSKKESATDRSLTSSLSHKSLATSAEGKSRSSPEMHGVSTAINRIAELAGRYYVFSAGDAGKIKRIRATPRVRLAACDVRGKVRSAWIEGRARIVLEPALIVDVRKALRRKYGLVMFLTDVMATMTGRMRRRAYIEIELADS